MYRRRSKYDISSSSDEESIKESTSSSTDSVDESSTDKSSSDSEESIKKSTTKRSKYTPSSSSSSSDVEVKKKSASKKSASKKSASKKSASKKSKYISSSSSSSDDTQPVISVYVPLGSTMSKSKPNKRAIYYSSITYPNTEMSNMNTEENELVSIVTDDIEHYADIPYSLASAYARATLYKKKYGCGYSNNMEMRINDYM